MADELREKLAAEAWRPASVGSVVPAAVVKLNAAERIARAHYEPEIERLTAELTEVNEPDPTPDRDPGHLEGVPEYQLWAELHRRQQLPDIERALRELAEDDREARSHQDHEDERRRILRALIGRYQQREAPEIERLTDLLDASVPIAKVRELIDAARHTPAGVACRCRDRSLDALLAALDALEADRG